MNYVMSAILFLQDHEKDEDVKVDKNQSLSWLIQCASAKHWVGEITSVTVGYKQADVWPGNNLAFVPPLNKTCQPLTVLQLLNIGANQSIFMFGLHIMNEMGPQMNSISWSQSSDLKSVLHGLDVCCHCRSD